MKGIVAFAGLVLAAQALLVGASGQGCTPCATCTVRGAGAAAARAPWAGQPIGAARPKPAAAGRRPADGGGGGHGCRAPRAAPRGASATPVRRGRARRAQRGATRALSPPLPSPPLPSPPRPPRVARRPATAGCRAVTPAPARAARTPARAPAAAAARPSAGCAGWRAGARASPWLPSARTASPTCCRPLTPSRRGGGRATQRPTRHPPVQPPTHPAPPPPPPPPRARRPVRTGRVPGRQGAVLARAL
jgi:hypothetical protein